MKTTLNFRFIVVKTTCPTTFVLHFTSINNNSPENIVYDQLNIFIYLKRNNNDI